MDNTIKSGKVIIFSAPSGSGKSTIINHLLEKKVPISFSISATSRPLRGTEVNGKEYHFLTIKEFQERISLGEFLEYEEVYPGRFYGTLKSEVDDKLQQGTNVVLDIDVKGALNVKKVYGDQALAIFIMPPSLEALRERLNKRGTDSPEVIEQRLAKADWEMQHASQFDRIILNDVLEVACEEAFQAVTDFINLGL